MASNIITWGIIAPGRIAHEFASAMAVVEGATILAVASRDSERGQRFAERYDIPVQYQQYSDLLSDPAIDAVYIANPHRFHFDTIRAALTANKHVLCEKPLTVTEAQAKVLFDLARSRKVLLMEALWTRYLPVWQAIQQHLTNKTIGDIIEVTSSFGFEIPRDNNDRLLNKALAGGVLLDMGIYPISLSTFISHSPTTVESSSVVIGPTGVDEQVTGVLHVGNTPCHFSCSFVSALENNFRLTGTKGTLEIVAPFWAATQYRLTHGNSQPHTFDLPHEASGFEYQIRAAVKAIVFGHTQEPQNTWADTQQVQRIMDTILSRAGVDYDFAPRTP